MAKRAGKRLAQPGILLVLVLAFAVRAALPVVVAARAADPKRHHAPDSASYLSLAETLAKTGRFETDGRPELVRTPGYPVFLLPGLLAGRVEVVTVALQVALSGLTVYLVYALARGVFERRGVATLCALLYAVEPLSVVYSSLLLTETLFTFLVVLFLLLLVTYLRRGGGAILAASAVVLAASAYVRPISYFLPVLIGFVLLLRAALSDEGRRRRFVHACVFLGVAGGLVGAWQVRNALRAGYRGFSAVVDVNLYEYQAAAVRAARTGRPYYEVRREMVKELGEAGADPAERFRRMGREGAGILRWNLGTYAGIHLRGMGRVMLDPGAFPFLKLLGLYREGGGLLGEVVDKGLVGTAVSLYQKRPLVFGVHLALGLVLGGYLLCSLVAVLSRALWANRLALLAVLVGLYLWGLSGGAPATARFRHPIMPVVCLLAGWGLSRLFRRRESSP